VCFDHRLWYPVDMLVVVLTGGIGSGKTVASQFFGRRGALVIDLDEVASRVMQPGSPVLASVAHEFGSQVVRSDGSLDRGELARVCFVDQEAVQRLDAIVHPAVERAVILMLDDAGLAASPPSVVVLEVPLLAEAPQFVSFGDVVLAISAPEDMRIERAVARGMDRSDVSRRASVQESDEARAALAAVVIENDGTLEEFLAQLERFWDEHVDVGADNG
jgi:dephospho-CoA kinase